MVKLSFVWAGEEVYVKMTIFSLTEVRRTQR